MKMTIFWVQGQKGGVGKSMIASVLIDYMLSIDITPLVIEADSSIPDVARRYSGIVPGALAPLSAAGDSYETVVAQMIETIESAEQDHIVINLPAAAAETLDPLALDFLQPSLEMIGAQSTIAFAVGPRPDSSTLAARSIESGLAAISDRRVAVVNGFFGDPGSFDWTRSDGRKKWLAAGGTEV